MNPTKFNLGQAVVIVEQFGANVKTGDVGVVTEVVGSETYVVRTDTGDWRFMENHLRAVGATDELTQKIEAPKVGVKFDAGKAPISLIPVEAIIEEAEVFAFGAKKYGRHNFRYGMDYSRLLDAFMRHALAMINGEDIDPESKLPHRAHARCCLSMLTYMQRNNVGKDDRFKKE